MKIVDLRKSDKVFHIRMTKEEALLHIQSMISQINADCTDSGRYEQSIRDHDNDENNFWFSISVEE